MSFTDTQRAELLAADGLLDPEAEAALRAAGVDPDTIRAQHLSMVGLLAPSTEAPDLVAAVFRAIDLDNTLQHAIPDALTNGAGLAPELSADVLSVLGHEPVTAEVLLDGVGMAPDVVRPVADSVGHSTLRTGEALLYDSTDAPELSETVTDTLGLDAVDAAATLLHGSGEAPVLDVVESGLNVGAVVRAEAGAAPDLVAQVLGTLQLDSTDVAAAITAEAGAPPNLAPAIIESVADATQSVLRRGAGEAPDLADDVLKALFDAPASETGDLLRAEAGPAPDLTVGVLDAIGLGRAESAHPAEASHLAASLQHTEPVEAAPSESNVVSLAAHRPSAPTAPEPASTERRIPFWAIAAVPAVLMAALALVFVMGAGTYKAADELGIIDEGIANRIDIEELASGAGTVVSVIQAGDLGDDSMPTIIFLDVLDEDDASTGTTGTETAQ